MSFGSNSSSGQNQSTSTANSFYDPTQTNLVDSNAANTAAAAQTGGSLAYTPYSGSQLSFGSPTTLNGLTSYSAPTVSASTYTPSTYTPTTVSTGQTNTDTQALLNPYTSDVVNSSLGLINEQQGQADAAAQAQATASGAFGGSRSAVLQNLTDQTYDLDKTSTIASLESQGYTTAQATALAEEQGNQSATNTAGQFNAGALNTAGQFNAGQTQAAATANQSASLASANTQLQALGINESQAEALFGANWQQYLNSQTDPQAAQALVNQAYGLTPQGALSTSTSQSTGQTASSGINLGIPGATAAKIPGVGG